METSKNYRQMSIMDVLTCSREDSHASHTAQPESEKDGMMTAICGQRCLELSESVNPAGSWERTFSGYVLGMEGWYSRRCALTWKLEGTPFNRLLFRLAVSKMPHTKETEFGLLLTPTTQEYPQDPEEFKSRMEKYPNGTTMPNLDTQVQELWPTPTATTHKGGKKKERKQKQNRETALKDKVSQMAGKPSQMSPRFVADMMGFPHNWTELPFQNGETKV